MTTTTTTYYEVSECSNWTHPADTGVVLEARTPSNRNDPKGMTARQEHRDLPQAQNSPRPPRYLGQQRAASHPRSAVSKQTRQTQQKPLAARAYNQQHSYGLLRPTARCVGEQPKEI